MSEKQPAVNRLSRPGTCGNLTYDGTSGIVHLISKITKNPAQALEITLFQKGQTIMSEGEQGSFFLVILSGQVVLSKGGRIIRTLDEQDIFGLENLLLKKPSYYAAFALQECRIAKYGPETLDHLIHESPRMIQNVLVSILHQLTQTTYYLLEPPDPFQADEERICFFKDKEVILDEMADGTDFYRLISTEGGLRVTIGGKETARIYKPGEFFGFPTSCGHTGISSIGESVVEKYGVDDLDIIIRDYPETARQIMRVLIERVSDIQKK
jgi:CRP-like cAMP-binding protein